MSTAHDALQAGEALPQALREFEELRRNEAWLVAQKEAFEAAVDGAPLERSLRILTDTALAHTKDAMGCGFWIADETQTGLHHVAGLPEAYARRINGFRIGPDSLACGLAVAMNEPVITPDVDEEPRWQPWLWLAREFGYRGVWSFPVRVNGGSPIGTFALYFPKPRAPSKRELELAWVMTRAASIIISQYNEAKERVRIETALRRSEARFQQFSQASSNGLWVRDRETLGLEYVSPAMSAIYDVSVEELLANPHRWIAIVLPCDRDVALGCLERVRQGERAVWEFRIQRPSDGRIRWIRSTGFPLADESGRVQRIAGISSDVTEEKHSSEHQTMLLGELQHRVRNIMAMMRSMVRRMSRSDITMLEFAAHLEARIDAMARTQAILTRHPGRAIDLETIICDELLAQSADESRITLTGPEVLLSPRAAELLTLALHELATNSLKYGALGRPEARLSISWERPVHENEAWLALRWLETGLSIERPQRSGFGTELITQRIPYELGGRSELTIDGERVSAIIEFPLRSGSSVMQTDGAMLRVVEP